MGRIQVTLEMKKKMKKLNRHLQSAKWKGEWNLRMRWIYNLCLSLYIVLCVLEHYCILLSTAKYYNWKLSYSISSISKLGRIFLAQTAIYTCYAIHCDEFDDVVLAINPLLTNSIYHKYYLLITLWIRFFLHTVLQPRLHWTSTVELETNNL